MLGLFFIYFLGKQYYNLAETHGKRKWGMAALSILLYYVWSAIGAGIFMLYFEFYGNGSEVWSERMYGFVGIPFGLIACYILYVVLKSVWEEKEEDKEFEYE